MQRRVRATWAVLAGVALITAACGGDDGGTTDTTAATTQAPSSEAPSTEAPTTEPGTDTTEPAATEPPATEPAEELEASDIGITEDTIKIAVAVADLEAVRAAGISIPETLTTEHLFDRWNVYAEKWNAEGGINGRQVEMVQVVWDPLDTASFDDLCAEVTVNQEVFALVNGTGLSAVAMECAVDSGVPILYGDVVAQSLFDTGLVISMAPSAEIIAAAGVQGWVDSGELPTGSKVGVLASNSPLISAAGAAAKSVLEEAGYEVNLIETNTLAGDNAATNEEGGAAVGAFQADGVEHAFLLTPFTENTGFWTAASAAGLPFTMLDTASSQCSSFGLSRAPAGAVGSSCATVFDHSTNTAGEIHADTEFEAECRAFYDEQFADYYGGASMPGVPAGQIITDAAGNTLISDYTPQECTISNVLQMALTNAGVNPTRDSFMEAALNLGEVPMALTSNGAGTLTADKPYMADSIHTVLITAAAADTAPDANGLYNGCAAPVNCGIVTSDWTPLG